MKKYIWGLLKLAALFCVLWVNEKYKLILIPTENMIDYQFDLFSVCAGLAGFSFTTLGILLGMASEPLMDKIKDTSIVSQKCKWIAVSLELFCGASIISLFFVTRCDVILDRILSKIFGVVLPAINQGIFMIEILCVFVGIIYFIVSVRGIYSLLKRVYGFKAKDYTQIRKNFKNALESAKIRQAESEKNRKEETESFLEK